MADKKISELTGASALTGAEILEVVQGGVNKQTTTQDIADLGGGGSVTSVTGTSNRITSTGGATPVIDISATYDAAITAAIAAAVAPVTIVEATADTTGATITLNFQVSSVDRQNVIFVGSASFTGSKTIAMSNTTNAKNFAFVFEITSFAGASITVPADWSLSSPDFTTGTTWTPTANGRYRMTGFFANSLWEVFVDGQPASV